MTQRLVNREQTHENVSYQVDDVTICTFKTGELQNLIDHMTIEDRNHRRSRDLTLSATFAIDDAIETDKVITEFERLATIGTSSTLSVDTLKAKVRI